MEDYKYESESGSSAGEESQSQAWEDLSALLQQAGISATEKRLLNQPAGGDESPNPKPELQNALEDGRTTTHDDLYRLSAGEKAAQLGAAGVGEAGNNSAMRVIEDMVKSGLSAVELKNMLSDANSPLGQLAEIGKNSALAVVKQEMAKAAARTISEIGAKSIRDVVRDELLGKSPQQQKLIEEFKKPDLSTMKTKAAAEAVSEAAAKGALGAASEQVLNRIGEQLRKHFEDDSIAKKIEDAVREKGPRSIESALKDIEIVKPSEGKVKLSTGDTLVRAGDKEILIDPGGSALYLDGNGGFDLDVKSGARVRHDKDGTSIEYANGDKIRIENGRIASVERNGKVAIMMEQPRSTELPTLPGPGWKLPPGFLETVPRDPRDYVRELSDSTENRRSNSASSHIKRQR